MHYAWHDIVGNLGVFLIISAFFLLQMEKIQSDTALYSWLNLIGALLVTVSLLFNFNLSSFVIEIFWIAISLIGLIKYYFIKKS